jgi:hypothetical protein
MEMAYAVQFAAEAVSSMGCSVSTIKISKEEVSAATLLLIAGSSVRRLSASR